MMKQPNLNCLLNALEDAFAPRSLPTATLRPNDPGARLEAAFQRPDPSGPEPAADEIPALPATLVNLRAGGLPTPPRHAPIVPGYHLLRLLGKGGMGVVYAAIHLRLNRTVALKMALGTGPEELTRLKTEAEALARLQHPNIVQVFDIGEAGGVPYFALEFCPGGSLEDSLHGVPMAARPAAEIVRTLALAIHAAHAAGVLHRDLKPSNVLLASDGTPKVSDFGLARKLDADAHTIQGTVLGSPSYMAPEQACGDVKGLGPSADVYALGATLYECLTGRPPFCGATAYDTLRLVIDTEPVPPRQLNPACPPDLEVICLKCLAKQPGQRYPTANLLAEDLGRYLTGEPIVARPAGVVERVMKWARRSPFQATTVGAAAALVVASSVALIGLTLAAHREAEIQRRSAEDTRRLGRVRERFEGHRSRAELAAAEARHAKDGREHWRRVESEAAAALALMEAEGPTDADEVARATNLRDQARSQIAAHARLQAFRARYGDALCFGSGMTGLPHDEAKRRASRAITEALGMVGVAPGAGRPRLDLKHHTPEETVAVRDQCYELLLLDTELALRAPADLRAAAARLERARHFAPEGRLTSAGLRLLARVLRVQKHEADARRAEAEAVRRGHRVAADHFFAGLDHFLSGRYGRALDSLADTVRLQPGHYGAEYVAALCRLEVGDPRGAREGLTRCLVARPDLPWARIARGFAAMEERRWEEAQADYDAVLNASPHAEFAYLARVNRGAMNLRRGEWSAAEADLRAAIASRPDWPAAYLNLASVLRHRTTVDPHRHALLALAPNGYTAILAVDAEQKAARLRALAVLDRAIEACPPQARLHRERAALLAHLGRDRAACEDLSRALALAAAGDPSRADDLLSLGRLMAQAGEHARALPILRAAAEAAPERPLVWRLLAQSLSALGRPVEAEAAMDNYLEKAARGGHGAGSLAEALRVRAEMVIDQAQGFRLRVRSRRQADDVRSALDSLSQSLRLVRSPEGLTLRGWTYLLANATDLASSDFDEALKAAPESADALIGRGTVRVHRGDARQAIDDVDRAVRVEGLASRLVYSAARVHALAAQTLPGTPTGSASAARSVDLLRQVLGSLRESERPGFWRDVVLADPAFAPLRRDRLPAVARAFGLPLS